ncbi:MAG: flagellar basal body L-ring protein FlgH, partial [Thermoguttaceae bacterium]
MTKFFFFIVVPFLLVASVSAQSGSLTGTSALQTANNRPVTMSQVSALYQPAPRQKVYNVQDIVRVRVDQKWAYTNNANLQRKKSVKSTSKLTAWFKFPDIFALPVTATDPLPEIGASLDHKTQNNGNLQRRESMTFMITCTVTDRLENGNLVIEGDTSSIVGEEGKVMYVGG